MKAEFCKYPYCFTDTGVRIHKDQFDDKFPNEGDTLEESGVDADEMKTYVIVGGEGKDENCMGGACSIPLPENRKI